MQKGLDNRAKNVKKSLNILLFISILFFSIWYVELNMIELIEAVPVFFQFIFLDFLPPDMSQLTMFIGPVIDTILLAFIATGIACACGLVLAILMAQNTAPSPILRVVIKAALTFCRNIPSLVWAAILVVIFGVGNLPGLLALVVFGTSFLARVYAEAIEELNEDVTEAIVAVGGNYFHVLKHAIMPRFMPSFLNWSLFMVEIGIRASAILGLVGAGGLGTLIKQTMDLFQYDKTAMVIIIMIALIMVVELTSQKLRERII